MIPAQSASVTAGDSHPRAARPECGSGDEWFPVGGERGSLQMSDRERLEQGVQPPKDTWHVVQTGVVVPEDETAGFDDTERLGRVGGDVRLGMRTIDEHQIGPSDIRAFVEAFAVAEELRDTQRLRVSL